MSRRGASLVAALLVVVLVEMLAALALAAAVGQQQLVAAGRDRVEGRALVGDALARVRVGAASALAALVDGEAAHWTLPSPAASWHLRVVAERHGAVVVLRGAASRRDGDGRLRAAAHATLLLVRNRADTLLVTAERPRW